MSCPSEPKIAGTDARLCQRNIERPTERSYPMGDKGGKKDKHKSKKQKESKDAQKARKKEDKQPKSIPLGK